VNSQSVGNEDETNREVDIGPKGVMSFTLLRLGLTWGEGSKAYHSGRFGVSWGLLGAKDVSNLLAELVGKMKNEPYGTGDALIMLLGEEKAREVATKEGVPLRLVSIRKRGHAWEEEEMSDNEGRSVKTRRR
jgi:hypothetical protein